MCRVIGYTCHNVKIFPVETVVMNTTKSYLLFRQQACLFIDKNAHIPCYSQTESYRRAKKNVVPRKIVHKDCPTVIVPLKV